MASKEDLSEQLQLTQKIAAAADTMARVMERIESSYSSQISMVEKLSAAMNELKNQDLDSISDINLEEVNKQFKNTSENASSLSDRLRNLGQQVSKKFPTSLVVGASALSGLAQGFRNVIALGKGLSGFLGGAVSWIGSLAGAIISIPLQIFDKLVSAAANVDGGMNEWAQALENLRKELGDLKGPGSSAVIYATKAMKGFSDTGLSTWRVFGSMAERLEYMTKIAVGMGAVFGVLTKEFISNSGALLGFQKGLGVTEDQMKSIGERSISLGKPMTKIFMEMTKQSLALGKSFDIDQKLIGKDMSKAMQDVRHFGSLATKEIAQASVYSRKLGVELEKITGILDAFETFDSAAENVAKLSQSFGVTVDAFKMMEAQSPAEQLDMLRKSFRDAGVDASKFSRQQAHLLASTTGLDEATVRQVFSSKNYGTSLDDIKKKSASAEAQTMSQAEAMKKLSDSIERLVKSGGSQQGSFFQSYLKGISAGIQSSMEFRSIIFNIKNALKVVQREGLRLGRAIVQIFPGIKELFGGISDFFKPGKFKALAKGVTDELILWMKDLSNPTGKASFSSLMDRLQKTFFNFFDSESPSGKKMLNGFKTIFTTITRIVAEGAKWVADKVASALSFVTEIITNPKALLAKGKSAAGGGLGFMAEILLPLAGALEHSWKVIAPALGTLIKTLGKKMFEYLKSDEFIGLIKPALPIVAAVLFGPMFARALLGAGLAALGKAAIGLFASSGSKKIMQTISERAASEVTSAAQKAASKGVGAATDGIKQVGAVNAAAGDAIKASGATDWGVRDAVKLGAKLVAIASAIALGGIMMAYSVSKMKKVLDGAGISTISDIIPSLAILGSMVVASVPLMLSMKLAAKVGAISEILKGGLIISAAVGIVGVTSTGIALLLKKAGNPSQLSAVGTIMEKMSTVYMKMIPLIFSSMALGVLASGPQAIALAAAAAGMGVISVAIAGMAGVVTQIVKELSQLKIDSDFQKKIDAFLSVMHVIQSFTDSLLNTIKMMKPTLADFLMGTSEKFTTKINAAKDLIAEMIGNKNDGKGMIGIIETVMSSIRQLNFGNGMSEAAGVFANVMQAITSFMQAATPPEAFFTEGGSFINKIADPSHGFHSLSLDIARYASLMREGMLTMLTGDSEGKGNDGIIGIIKKLTTITVPSSESTTVITNMISATADIIKSLSPSPESMKAFSNTEESSTLWGLYSSKVQKMNFPAIKASISSVAKAMKEIMPVLMNDVISGIISKSKGISKDQLENIKIISNIMSTITGLASSITSLAKGRKVTPQETKEGVKWATEDAPNIEHLFDSIGTSVPRMFGSITSMMQNIKIDDVMLKSMDKIKSVFSFLGEIPKLAIIISDASKAAGGSGALSSEPMFASLAAVGNFFWRIANEKGYGSSQPILSELLTNIKSVGNIIANSKDTFSSSAINQLTTVIDGIKNYNEQITKITTSIKTEGLTSALGAAAEMVKIANQLDAALSDGIKLETPVKLGKLASGLGLGGKYNYTIKNKEIVINMNVQVTMNVDEVEKVLILRKNSFVRDRINLALNSDSSTKNASLPDNSNSPMVMPFVRVGE